MPHLTTRLPQQGQPKTTLLSQMKQARDHDVNWREGKAFSLVFQAGEDVAEVSKAAYAMYFSENGLNPGAFPSLRRFETEVIGMAAELLGGDGQVAGNMTSGGRRGAAGTIRRHVRHDGHAAQPR